MNTATLQESATSSSSAVRTAMTEEERYLFDLQGFLVVPNALSREQLAALNATLDLHIADEVEPSETKHRFWGPESLLSWGPEYRALIDHAPVMPYVTDMVGSNPRLDHDYIDIIRPGHPSTDADLHGGNVPFDECCFYAHHDGRIRCGLIVVAYNLHDVNPGDGGFAGVIGSHKSNQAFPKQWMNLQNRHHCVSPITGPAGTAIIFTEALTHGPLPWRGSHERRTLFYKYSPCSISWSSQYYDATEYPDLTARQRAMLEAPNARFPQRPTPALRKRR